MVTGTAFHGCACSGGPQPPCPAAAAQRDGDLVEPPFDARAPVDEGTCDGVSVVCFTGPVLGVYALARYVMRLHIQPVGPYKVQPRKRLNVALFVAMPQAHFVGLTL